MTFDKTDTDSLWLSCTFSPKNSDSSFNDETNEERKDRLNKLRDQIRAGTYRPTIGEIAVNLVRERMDPGSF